MSEKLTVVKAEIKHWEHAFKAQNGREPTRDDIKANPAIADRYKSYNKLKKASREQSNGINDPPTHHRTPSPRPARSASTAAIPPKPLPTASPASLNTRNPFSPHKKKYASPSAEPLQAVWNPFMTPLKSAPVVRACASSTPSPELLTYSKPPQPAREQNPVISKARKRLRGDSVSPSPPQRDKYIRTNDSALNLLHQTNLFHEEDHDDSFIEESPVKPSTNGKSFQPLFNDISSHPSASSGRKMKAFKRAKTEPGKLFGSVKDRAKDGSVHDVFIFSTQRADVLVTDGSAAIPITKRRKTLPGPRGLIPGKDNLFEESSRNTIEIQPSSSRKRGISNVIRENTDKPSKPRESNEWNLLPPSPVIQEKKPWYNTNSKKKKQKLVERPEHTDDKDDDESETEIDSVDITVWHGAANFPQKDGDSGWEVDPELQTQFRLGDVKSQPPEPEIFDIDLPKEMQQMLSLSPKNVANKKADDALARNVIQGRRQGGAKVWGPGEFGGESELEGSEGMNPDLDEWEGEGVPWEVGEL